MKSWLFQEPMSHGVIGRGGRGKGFSGGRGVSGGKGFGSSGDSAAPAGAKVYVGNLSWDTSWQDLKDHFRQAGEVQHADVLIGADGRSKGCGLVTFSTAREAAHAIETLHDTTLGNRSIFVREDREAVLPGLPAPAGRGAAPARAAAPVCPSIANSRARPVFAQLRTACR